MRIHFDNRRMLGGALALLSAGLLGTQLVGRGRADGIPETQALAYAGVLTDANGTPLTGTKTIRVRVWDSETGGTAQCPEVSDSQSLSAGAFRVPLSDACAQAIHARTELYVEVVVDGASLGRAKLGAVPYAVEAHTASNAAGMLAADIDALRSRIEERAGASPGISAGSSPESAAASCAALRAQGVGTSGTFWVRNPAASDATQVGNPVLVYCDQVSHGGGWAMLANSILGPDTLRFWNIPYAQRASRRGRPSLDANFYDGSLYQTNAATYMDVIEDLQGNGVVAFVATSAGINSTSMRFSNPVMLEGNAKIFDSQFANGWSASDYDGDSSADLNCATQHNGVTQHYTSCWNANLGSDPDTPDADGGLGPHVSASVADALKLVSDGTNYTRVRRMTRYVKW